MNAIFEMLGLSSGNTGQLVIMLLVFVTVVMLVGAVYFLLTNRRMAPQRLARMTGEGDDEEAPASHLMEQKRESGLFGKVTSSASKVAAPRQEEGRRRLRQKLVQAGFQSRQAVTNYIAIKVVLALLFPAVYMFRNLFYKITPETAAIMLLLALAGFFLPTIFLHHLTQKRQQGIVLALPDALDLMVICVEAGLGLDMTFKRVGDEMLELNKDLSDEFFMVTREIRAGANREDSFKHMAWRTGVPEIHNLMTILTQTSRFGTSVAKALRVHADAMRVKRRQIAEEQAAKSAVKLVFPLVMFIFPTIIVVLAGPAAIRIIRVLVPAFSGG
ncbi:MAG: type II secretion system protein [Desulfuromonas sp.]|nr:MAG: type II secretion system protein [Desulfuromonas sp.]